MSMLVQEWVVTPLKNTLKSELSYIPFATRLIELIEILLETSLGVDILPLKVDILVSILLRTLEPILKNILIYTI